MPFFLAGDELGTIRSIKYQAGSPLESEVLNTSTSGSAVSSISVASSSKIVTAAYADGSLGSFVLEDEKLEPTSQWKETRIKSGQTFVGLKTTDKCRGTYSCTSNGALRLASLETPGTEARLASLPSRLCDWKLSTDQSTFSYGGDEVELSVWDTEKAFSPTEKLDASKRKRDSLFPGEIWRAKNVSNDGLGLRQPVKITSLAYLSTTSPRQNIVTGTQLGDVRMYDTRARKPVTNWKGIAKVGGVKLVEKGSVENEIFVGDHGCNLASVDLRNGRILYSYKGMSGAVTSVAVAPSLLVSSALDRYCRIHTTAPPPTQPGQNQETKGSVVDKVFLPSIPTVVAWNGISDGPLSPGSETEHAEEDDVWDGMQDVEDSADEAEAGGRKRRRTAI
ncbi:unnamed protein product [Mycena citricolor]|uniref:Ribosome biogenesis protein NSA1 n=1 Tax=Mycena citricolor TaxID=2018698 RepID=A0AAD2HKU0_9AGAR|nr:unnamed protein product [Mycena citricolor]